jgi:hypothetical protein
MYKSGSKGDHTDKVDERGGGIHRVCEFETHSPRTHTHTHTHTHTYAELGSWEIVRVADGQRGDMARVYEGSTVREREREKEKE